MIRFVRITLPINAVGPNDAVLQLQREYKLPEGFFDFSSARGIVREYLDADGKKEMSWIKDALSQDERDEGR